MYELCPIRSVSWNEVYIEAIIFVIIYLISAPSQPIWDNLKDSESTKKKKKKKKKKQKLYLHCLYDQT